ncbi:MAG: hypothetical protein IIY21_06090 [Clostridiales bacterium]|nr:hypothetical protein [Clostridiales bacterium]
MAKYKVVDGISFDKDTPDRVCRLLLSYMNTNPRVRIRLFYGDKKTGKDWCSEFDIMGYIGRSMGPVVIPLLINNRNSIGGNGIPDGCIVRITVDKMDVYRHPKYHIGKITFGPSGHANVPYGVFIDGENRANFKTQEKAKKWVQFILGNSNIKG